MNDIIDEKPPRLLLEEKGTWKKPVLTRLGHLKDFVQGTPKAGSSVDGDPFSMRRKG